MAKGKPLIAALALASVALGFSHAAGKSAESCNALKAQYSAGYSSLVGEVRQKSPVLLMRYAATVGGGVPSKAKALGALSTIKPHCVETLGADECNRLLAHARAFILTSHRLNAAFDGAGCPGRIDG